MHLLQRMFSTKLSLQIITLICTALVISSCGLVDSDNTPKPTILTGVTLSAADFQKLRDNHRPLKSFDEIPPPPAPNYASGDSWAALWPRADEADVAPPNTAYPEAQNSAQVDVFFVHPTCYTKKDFWNGPIDNPDVQNTVSFMMKYMASVFNSTARVYAPRYRQFTLFSVVENETTSGMQAIELAYSDVERAFDYYIKYWNQGRPFILASHSQGSMHSGRLLQTKIVGTPIQPQLVAAYLIGMAIPDNLPGIEPARSATDTGVYINWNSLTAGADPRFFTEDIVIWVGNAYRKSKGISILQVNPLSWFMNGGLVAASNNPGSLPSDSGNDLRPLMKGITSADASGNILVIEQPAVASDFPGDGPDAPLLNAYYGDYHNYDYQLFYESIRKNAIDRVNAYLTK
jgi:hypothetical protein